MTTKRSLKITTPHGEFNRKTNTAYTHAVVRESIRAQQALTQTYTSGVHGRWIKDRGFAVTWHGSEQAARNAAAKPYLWDATTAVLGIFPVEA